MKGSLVKTVLIDYLLLSLFTTEVPRALPSRRRVFVSILYQHWALGEPQGEKLTYLFQTAFPMLRVLRLSPVLACKEGCKYKL